MSSSSGCTSCGSTGSALAGEPSSRPASGLKYQLSSAPTTLGQRVASMPCGGAKMKAERRLGTRPMGAHAGQPRDVVAPGAGGVDQHRRAVFAAAGLHPPLAAAALDGADLGIAHAACRRGGARLSGSPGAARARRCRRHRARRRRPAAARRAAPAPSPASRRVDSRRDCGDIVCSSAQCSSSSSACSGVATNSAPRGDRIGTSAKPSGGAVEEGAAGPRERAHLFACRSWPGTAPPSGRCCGSRAATHAPAA